MPGRLLRIIQDITSDYDDIRLGIVNEPKCHPFAETEVSDVQIGKMKNSHRWRCRVTQSRAVGVSFHLRPVRVVGNEKGTKEQGGEKR